MAYLCLARRVQKLIPFDPVLAPHKTKSFWVAVAVCGLLPVLLAPLCMIVIGYPPFPLRVQFRSGVITFTMIGAFLWLGFRFGRPGWFVVAILMFAVAILMKALFP